MQNISSKKTYSMRVAVCIAVSFFTLLLTACSPGVSGLGKDAANAIGYAASVPVDKSQRDISQPAGSVGNTATAQDTGSLLPGESGENIAISDIPDYSGSPYVEINGNIPEFTDTDFSSSSYESYSDLDYLGRCGVAIANIGLDIMPTEERGEIGSVKPSGWHTVKYDCVDSKYLYNRCHLIGYQLAGENANEKNLITGTRYLNVEGMLPFENMVDDYIEETGNHVLYRVTPVFTGENLVASGVQMEALSVEDSGDGVSFNIYCYNVQPGISIDYATGDSWEGGMQTADGNTSEADTISAEAAENPETTNTDNTDDEISPVGTESSDTAGNYILNTSSMKFHNPSCTGAAKINDENKQEYTGDRESLVHEGYVPCGICNP